MDNSQKRHIVTTGIALAVIFTTLNLISAVPTAFGQTSLRKAEPSWVIDPLYRKQYLREQWLARKIQPQQLVQNLHSTKSTSPDNKCRPSCNDLLAKLRQQSSINVIVSLDIPDLPDETRVAEEMQPAVMEERKHAIARAQGRLAKRMSRYKTDIDRRSQPQLSPTMGLTVDIAGLEDLIANPEVKQIHESKFYGPMLPQSTLHTREIRISRGLRNYPSNSRRLQAIIARRPNTTRTALLSGSGIIFPEFILDSIPVSV